MLKRVKEYFVEKREIRKLMLDTAKKMNNIATTFNLLTDVFSADGGIEKFSMFMDNIAKLTTSPELTTEYFKQVNENAHAERMAAMKAEK